MSSESKYVAKWSRGFEPFANLMDTGIVPECEPEPEPEPKTPSFDDLGNFLYRPMPKIDENIPYRPMPATVDEFSDVLQEQEEVFCDAVEEQKTSSEAPPEVPVGRKSKNAYRPPHMKGLEAFLSSSRMSHSQGIQGQTLSQGMETKRTSSCMPAYQPVASQLPPTCQSNRFAALNRQEVGPAVPQPDPEPLPPRGWRTLNDARRRN